MMKMMMSSYIIQLTTLIYGGDATVFKQIVIHWTAGNKENYAVRVTSVIREEE